LGFIHPKNPSGARPFRKYEPQLNVSAKNRVRVHRRAPMAGCSGIGAPISSAGYWGLCARDRHGAPRARSFAILVVAISTTCSNDARRAGRP
jgi:hypothetical protein